jgi:hypothetical protein
MNFNAKNATTVLNIWYWEETLPAPVRPARGKKSRSLCPPAAFSARAAAVKP